MMLLLINRKDLMGTFVNPLWMNAIAWTTAVIVVGLSAALMFTT
jgi:Mn2+/Fe2+ NRAMP family transporter